MSDHRTTEQLTADKDLEDAINRREEAYGTPAGVLMEYLVITTRAIVLPDGTEATVTDYYGGDRDPVHRTYGLLAWTLERMRAEYLRRRSGDADG